MSSEIEAATPTQLPPIEDASSAAAAEQGASTDKRKEELRLQGEAYFERVLAEASQEANTYASPPPLPSGRRRRDPESLDPDLETVGVVLEGARLYAIALVFLASTAVSLVLMQAALGVLPAPGLQASLHGAAAAVALLPLAGCCPALSLAALRGVAVTAVLSGAQLLTLLGALNFGSVYLVLGWTTLVPVLLRCELGLLWERKLWPVAHTALMVLGGGSLLVVVIGGLRPSLLGLLCLLAWTAGEVGGLAWEASKHAADAGEHFWGPRVADWLRGAAVAEAGADAGALALLRVLLPILPLLGLGLACQEGVAWRETELSVPAVGALAASAAAWAAALGSGLLLAESLAPGRRLALRAAASLATLALQLRWFGVESGMTLLACILAVLAGHIGAVAVIRR